MRLYSPTIVQAMKPSKSKIGNQLIQFLDKLVYFFGIVMVIMTLPQALIIWSNKSAVDVSLLTWGTYLIMSSIMGVYGYMHGKRPIFISYTAVTVVEIFIVIGIIVF